MRWAAIRVEVDGSQDAADAAAQVLLRLGSAGVATTVDADDRVVAVTGYLPEDGRLEPSLRQARVALAMLPTLGIDGAAGETHVRMVEEEDWASSWKQYFKPIRVGRRIIVTPPWETPNVGEGDRVIVIDPGMAFGTGAHPTTQLCLAALEDYITCGESTVADIGTGSGILAIAASKLGARSVTAIDIDPIAVRVARENAAANAADVDVRSGDDWGAGPYDLIVANIVADTLVALAERIAAAVTQGGIYIASGIIDTRETDVRLFTEAEGFRPIDARRQGEWAALVFRRTQD